MRDCNQPTAPTEIAIIRRWTTGFPSHHTTPNKMQWKFREPVDLSGCRLSATMHPSAASPHFEAKPMWSDAPAVSERGESSRAPHAFNKRGDRLSYCCHP